MLLLLLLLLLFTLHLSFLTKRKIKEKEKSGVRIRAMIGQIRTRDPDPGHFGSDFDPGSGHGSAFTDPGPGARLKARTFWTFCRLFTDFFRTPLVPEKICSSVRVERGELLLFKSGLKQEKLSVRPRYFLNCAQVFTRVEGGSEAPIRRMARWGLQVNRHGTSFIKILTSILVYVFAITFSHSCMGG